MKTLKYLLIGLSAIFAVIGFLVFSFYLLWDYGITHAPKDYYKKRLEVVSRDTLPSFKILQNDYVEESRISAIIQLDGADYAKSMKAMQSSENFKPVSEIYYWGVTEELFKKEHIDLKQANQFFEGNYGGHYMRIGFLPPNIVIYEEEYNWSSF